MVSCSIEPGIVTLGLVGRYSFGDVMRVLRSALDDSRLAHEPNLLLDIRESQETRTHQELVALADFIEAAQGLLGPRCAVVAGDELRFGLGRELAGWAASRGISVRVFRGAEYAAGKAWLLANAPEMEEP
jgi:hypothetical protein